MTDEQLREHQREHGSVDATLRDHERRMTKLEQLNSRLLIVTIGAVLTTIGTVVAAIIMGGIQ